ncbi:hypothetical protein ACTJKO_15385 [Curtobacterium sp. 22159]|uniref:hypothetical protein n=1 Tax=Curtobacterium sp. 22159 TaxID=3453882 RepID=UPI003F85618C
MFRLGWRVFRERLGEVRDPAKVRRASWLAVGAAALAAIGLSWLQVTVDWTGVGTGPTIAVLVLASVGVGLAVYACCPTANEPAPSATINGRRIRPDSQTYVRQSVGPYLLRRARTVRPEDAAAVISDVGLLQRSLIRRTVRFGAGATGLLCWGVAVLLTEQTNWFTALLPFSYAVALPELLVELGRSERARRSALAASESAPGPRVEAPGA